MSTAARAARGLRPAWRAAATRGLASTPPSSHVVSTEEASGLVGASGVRFIDIRDPRRFDAGHVPGASNIIEFFTYLATSSPQGVEHMTRTFQTLLREKGINGDERLITYEDTLHTMFGASCRGWYVLRTLGHANVQVMEGGWQKWLREGRAVSTDPEPAHAPGAFTAALDRASWADFGDVSAILAGQRPGVKLLDVRDKVEWDGLSSSPYGVDFAPRKGRLSGATHVEWYDFLTADGRASADSAEDVHVFKQPAEVRALMRERGFEPSDEIVLYCFKGARASNTLLALRAAGFENTKLYFASWNEWSRQASAAIDDRTF